MQFDAPTTLIAIGTIVAVFGLQLLFFWVRDRRAPWLAWYSAAFIFGAIAIALYLGSSKGHEFLMLGTGNAARLLTFAFFWHGAREFAGRRPEQSVVVLVIAVWMALCSIPAFLGSMEWRIIVSSLVIAAFTGLAARELWRCRDEGLPSLLPGVVTLASFTAFAASRVPLANIAPFPVGALPISGPWVAGFGLVVFIHAAFLVGFSVSMTRERREVEQRKFALMDPLTGLLNRRAFLDEAARVASTRRGTREALSVLVLDLDDFKAINDRYGHDAGDQVLQHFADVARGATRPTDKLYRMGGEEFCFVLPTTAGLDARLTAEGIRTRFAEDMLVVGGQTIRATVSIGVATTDHGGGADLELLLSAGDAAAYAAKAHGRNQTVTADASGALHPLRRDRRAAAMGGAPGRAQGLAPAASPSGRPHPEPVEGRGRGPCGRWPMVRQAHHDVGGAGLGLMVRCERQRARTTLGSSLMVLRGSTFGLAPQDEAGGGATKAPGISALQANPSVVMAGLDPATQPNSQL